MYVEDPKLGCVCVCVCVCSWLFETGGIHFQRTLTPYTFEPVLGGKFPFHSWNDRISRVDFENPTFHMWGDLLSSMVGEWKEALVYHFGYTTAPFVHIQWNLRTRDTLG